MGETYVAQTCLTARLPLNIEDLDVLNLGAGRSESPISVQLIDMPFRSLINVEVWEPYLTELRALRWKAQSVANVGVDAVTFVDQAARVSGALMNHLFDVTLMIDFIEHFEKHVAWEMLSQCILFSHRVVLFLPFGPCPQGDVHGNPHQQHLSTWYTEDFKDARTVEVFEGFHTHVQPPAAAAWVTYE